jgi:CheY-like chemotaxis protein
MRMLARAPDKAQRHFENAMDGANRASALTKRLLAFARAEPAMPEHLVPGDAIRSFFDLIDRTIGDRIELAIDDRAGDWQCWVDRSQLENALLNLAVNARDAMAGHGSLTIATRQVHERVGASAILTDFVAISVSDTGCGMAPEVAERVFDPFYTTKPVGQGTGLGMSQVFAFARQSQGDVRLESTEGVGTTVTMLLPRVAAPAPRVAQPDQRLSATGEPAANGMKVLLVEDDPRVLVATRDALVELGHTVVACDNPRNAAALLRDHGDIGFILSDVLMPEMTGPEMVAQILPDWPDMPILFATGFAGEAGEADAFGGHEVIRKPYTLAALEAAMVAAKARSACRNPYVAAVAAAI